MNSMSDETGGPAVEEAPKPKGPRLRTRRVKVDEVPAPSHMNWLIHAAYIKKDFETAENISDHQLVVMNDRCEYALFVKALICRHRGKMQESLDLFQKAMYLNPHNHANAKQVARSLVLMSRYVSAIDVYDQIISKGARDWHVLHNRSICLSHIGRAEEAKACLREALSLHKHDISFLQLGKLYIQEGNIDEAIAIYLEALNYSPENVELFTTLGLMYLQLEDTRKAFDYFGRALTYNPKDTTAILGASSVIQECDDYDVALIKYRVSAAVSPEAPELWNNIGMCFFGKKKMVAAIACLKHARYLNPFEWKTSFNLGLVHLKTQQYASAFQYLSAAVNMEPQFAESYMLLGSALAYLDDLPNAITAFKKAADLDGAYPMIQLNYAIVLHANDDFAGAADRLEHFGRLIASSAADDNTQEMQDIADKLQMKLAMGASMLAK